MVRVDLYATSVGLPSSWRNNFQRHPARTVGQQRYPHLDSFLTLKLQNERADFRCNVAAEPTGSRAHLTRCVDETGDNEYRTAARTDFVAETLLPTQQGKFRLRGYRHTIDDGKTFTEPSAIISGTVEHQENVVVRVHDACFTSEVLGSLKCDCREQLQLAMKYIHNNPPGMVIYLQQEGRGIGLANKIAAYALQEKGLDTVDANRALGLPDDCREYSAVRHILEDLGIKSIRLMTNNPRKIKEMEALGIQVSGRVPCIVKPTTYNEGYLTAKERRMDHMFSGEEFDAEHDLNGQYCYWNHEGEPSASGVTLNPKVDMDSEIEEVAEAMSAGLIKRNTLGETPN